MTARLREKHHWLKRVVLVALVLRFIGSVSAAQEMEPRAYSRAPVGSQFVLLTYAYQSGDVLTDSSLPLQDVKVKLNAGSFAYGRTFGLAGRQASVSFAIPYIKGSVSGQVFEEQQRVTRSGLGDVRIRFTMNLIGSPALSPKEFVTYQRKTVIGASVSIITPTGQYDPARLVNLSSHRWAFKPEVGVSQPRGHWTFEAAAGAWFFTANNNFFGTSRRQQHPLLSIQGDVVYTMRPRMWISANGTYFRGGQSVVNGNPNADRQSNSRIGVTYALPLNPRHSIKIAWARGLTTRFGGDFNTIAFAWQYAW